jgi:Cu/Ag efflux pump CusA
MALGAEAVTTTVEGRERYTVSIRYPRDLRSHPQAIVPAGMMGDRADVIFVEPGEIGGFISDRC